MKRILYWFRNDLRLHDNDGFARAVAAADAVLPVFVFDPGWFLELPRLGFRKTGIYRANFLIEAVADLRQSLQHKGADLIVRIGDPAKVLAELAEDTEAEAIYAGKEVTQEETDVESDLSKRLKPLNVDLELFWGSTLYHVRDLPFEVARLPDGFTPFRHQVEQSAEVRELILTPGTIVLVAAPSGGPVPAGDMPTLTALGFPDEQIEVLNRHDDRSAVAFSGGESVALTRLERYIWEQNLVRTYKETRNGMLAETYSSKFSAWLSLGCLSPRLIYWEVKRYERERVSNDRLALQSTYWLVFELLWRDFFRFVALRHGTRIFKSSGIRHDLTRKWRRDPDVFRRWVNGQTGIPFIDANMREMNATGFMSNRGRQNVASFLVSDLGIDWTWGAAYFESLLVDYDPASNWGNWNYVAGVGNDPRGIRQPRYFNIYQQALRYDEAGQYVKHWIPELDPVPADKVHLVANLSPTEQAQYGLSLGIDYPLPIINPNRWLSP